MRRFIIVFLTVAMATSCASATGIFLNELHYDNASGDVGEFVEIAVPAGTGTTGVTVTLYNGSNGTSYDSTSTFVAGATGVVIGSSSYDLFTWNPGSIQNGAPDGLSIDLNGVICEFVSYEGVVSATDGPANGSMSMDIGVAEGGGTLIGESLQLINGTWMANVAETPGADNNIVPEPSGLALSILATLGILGIRRRS